MSKQALPDIEFEEEYILGLIDYLSRPSFEPVEMTSGYGLNTRLYISLRQSEIILGILSNFFDGKDIKYQYKQRDSEGLPREILVGNSKSIADLHRIGQGRFIQTANQLEYLVAVDHEYRGKTIAGNEELFYSLYKPWAEMHPYREDRKFTLDFFEKEFDTVTGIEPFEFPDPEYPKSLSTEYVAGVFDATGKISLRINKQSANSTGYGMHIYARMAISHPDIRVKPKFVQYFQDSEVDPIFSQKDGDLRIRFSSVDSVEALLEDIGPDLIYQYDLCEVFYSQLIPAYKDQYHTTKEGFLDMLKVFEKVAPDRPRAKYTTEYFENEWGPEI